MNLIQRWASMIIGPQKHNLRYKLHHLFRYHRFFKAFVESGKTRTELVICSCGETQSIRTFDMTSGDEIMKIGYFKGGF